MRIAVCRDIFGVSHAIYEWANSSWQSQMKINYKKECQNWKGSCFLVPWPLGKPALHDDSCILNEEQSRTLAISLAVLVLISSNFWKAESTHKRNNYGFSSMAVSINWKYFPPVIYTGDYFCYSLTFLHNFSFKFSTITIIEEKKNRF